MESSAVEDVRKQLAALFLVACDDVVRKLQDMDVPFTVTTFQTFVERNGKSPDAWKSSQREVVLNILTSKFAIPLHQLAPLLMTGTCDRIREIAAQLVDLDEAQLPHFAPFSGSAWVLFGEWSQNEPFDSDPAAWVVANLLAPALIGHLRDLPRVDAASDKDATHFAADVLRFLCADEMTYELTVPLGGIDLAATRNELGAGDAIIYRLTDDARGQLMSDWGLHSQGKNMFSTMPVVALQLMLHTGRTAQNPLHAELVAAWKCALQLHGFTLSGVSARGRYYPSWIPFGTIYAPINLSARTHTWKTMTPGDFSRVQETVNKLSRYKVNEPRSANDLALHRFSNGSARESAADAVVDFVIALESLLLPYDEAARHGDLGYRFRIHGAHYLAKTKAERTKVAKQLTELYGLRSQLVHGGNYPSASVIETGRQTAGELTRRGLLRAVTEGKFPSAEMFKKMVLGVS